MKFFSFCTVQFLMVLLVFFICLATTKASSKVPRSKVSSFYGLTPTLRVGRSSAKWNTYNSDIKRYGKLMAFPRVGRAGGATKSWQNDDGYGKRAGSNTGMWFGPRLGRIQKRNIALDNAHPWTYIIFNDIPSFNRQIDYSPEVDPDSVESGSDEYKEIPSSSSADEQSA